LLGAFVFGQLTMFSHGQRLYQQAYNNATASAVVVMAVNAIKITIIAIAVKPNPRLDALLILNRTSNILIIFSCQFLDIAPSVVSLPTDDNGFLKQFFACFFALKS
jgi:hypothetical protein